MAVSRLQNEALEVLQDLKESFMQMYDDIEHYKRQTKQIDTKIAGCRRVLREVQMGDLGDVVMIDENGFGHLPRSGRGITINLANHPRKRAGGPGTYLTASSDWAGNRSDSSGRGLHSEEGSVLASPPRSAVQEVPPLTPAEEPIPVSPSSFPMQPSSPEVVADPPVVASAVLSPNTAFEADVHATLHETEELLRFASDLSHGNPRHTIPVGTDFTKLAQEVEAEAGRNACERTTTTGFDDSAEEITLAQWQDSLAPPAALATLSPSDTNLPGRHRLNTSMRSTQSLMTTATTLPSRFVVPAPSNASDQDNQDLREHEEDDVLVPKTTQSSLCPEFSATLLHSQSGSAGSLAKKLPSSSEGTAPSALNTDDQYHEMAERHLASGLWKAKQDPRGHTYYYNTKDKSQRTWNLKKHLAKQAASAADDAP